MGVVETPVAPVEDGAQAAVFKPVPLRRVKRLERPNKAEFDEAVGKLQAEMDGLQNRVREIKTILDNKQQSRGMVSPVKTHYASLLVCHLNFCGLSTCT